MKGCGCVKVDGGKLGSVGFEYLGVPYSEMDCQAFVEKCLADCGLKKDLPGSNAWYREVLSHGWVGTPEECVSMYGKVPPGAFLFILEHDGKEPAQYQGDGIGNASHIGICTGTQGAGAIHSSSSRGCVAESKFKGKTIPNGGWNRVGLWDEVDYNGATPAPEPTPEPEPEIATVYAANGKPVKLRAKPSTKCSLYWEVPVGETVVVYSRKSDWCNVDWNGIDGYMMTEFLLFCDDPAQTYCVTICGLSYAEAQDIMSEYPDAEIMKERG